MVSGHSRGKVLFSDVPAELADKLNAADPAVIDYLEQFKSENRKLWLKLLRKHVEGVSKENAIEACNEFLKEHGIDSVIGAKTFTINLIKASEVPIDKKLKKGDG